MTKKHVLVTGADGFIGSHLVELLVQEGYSVKALVQYNSLNSWGWLDSLACKNSIEVVSGDIRDPYFCREIVTGCSWVFHLAALIAIPYSYSAPNSYVDTNVNGTLNMCQASLAVGVEKFVHTSTSEVYGTAQYVPIDEKHPLQPQSPYSASKIAADAMVSSYFHSFDLPVVIARPFNTYGPRQSARAVIPTIITQIANGAEAIELGDLSPTRDFNYVTDTCRGFLALAKSEKTIGEIVNIGSNFEISIKDTLSMIKHLMSSNVEFICDEKRMRPANSEVLRLWADNKKVKKLASFSPEVSLEVGLKKTIEWFTTGDNLALYKSNIYNV